MAATIRELLRAESKGYEKSFLSFEPLKARGHDTDDRMLFAVEQDRAIENIAVAAVTALPKRVTEHDHFVCVWSILFRQKATTDQWLHAELRKEVVRDSACRDSFRFAVARQVQTGFMSRSNVFKRLRLIFPVHIISRRGSVAWKTDETRLFPQNRQPFRIAKL